MLLLVTLIDMWWCWYLWWYWFEMTLLIKTMSTWIDGTVNDYVHINEVVVVLITSLRRDDVYEWCENGMLIDVGNALACACCVCSRGAKCTDLLGSLALASGHVHASYMSYPNFVWGPSVCWGATLAWPLRGTWHPSLGNPWSSATCRELKGRVKAQFVSSVTFQKPKKGWLHNP